MSPATLSLLVLGLALLALVVVAVAVVRNAPRSRGSAAIAGGDFEGALAAAGAASATDEPEREELFTAAFAAKHLLDLERAAELLDRILAADDGDGEAWLERGLVEAYAAARGEPGAGPSLDPGGAERALAALAKAESLRSDLAESIALHRAWVELGRGRRRHALGLFDDIQVPLETKLRLDLGPGDPVFSEWFVHAGDLWRAAGREDAAAWAHEEARRAAPGSRLVVQLVTASAGPLG